MMRKASIKNTTKMFLLLGLLASNRGYAELGLGIGVDLGNAHTNGSLASQKDHRFFGTIVRIATNHGGKSDAIGDFKGSIAIAFRNYRFDEGSAYFPLGAEENSKRILSSTQFLPMACWALGFNSTLGCLSVGLGAMTVEDSAGKNSATYASYPLTAKIETAVVDTVTFGIQGGYENIEITTNEKDKFFEIVTYSAQVTVFF